jgi:hypothetical protein
VVPELIACPPPVDISCFEPEIVAAKAVPDIKTTPKTIISVFFIFISPFRLVYFPLCVLFGYDCKAPF